VVIVHSAGKKLETGKKERYQHDVTMGMSRKKTKKKHTGDDGSRLFLPNKKLAKLRRQHDGRPGASDRSDDLGAVDAPIRSLCRSRWGGYRG